MVNDRETGEKANGCRLTRCLRCAPPASPSPARATGRPAPWNGRAGLPRAGPRPSFADVYAYATLTLRDALNLKRKAPGTPGAFCKLRSQHFRLLERGVDRGELGVQVGAEAIDDRDDRQRNAGGNEAVFDRGGAGLVLHETGKQVLHNSTPCTRGCRT